MPLTILSMGQTIKKLRKERNLTQEELAEQLNVTYQAVSKWENETGMPDISQIVPLASVFGVSTDVLFGTYGTSDDDEVNHIIEKAYGLNDDKTMPKKIVYDELQKGLQRFPNNLILLMSSLEYGITLSYLENDCYDKIHGQEIYQECIRQANLITSYSKNITDVLRANMIMVLLHSAYRKSEKAWEHANKFPWRCDMTYHVMSAYIAHAEKDYPNEALYCQRDIMYHLEAMFDSITQLGDSYRYMQKYDYALKMFNSIFYMIELVFGGENIMPPLHCRERGDIHALIAKTYIEMGDIEKALSWLEKMVDYDTTIRSQFRDDMYVDTPFLHDVKFTFYYAHGSNKKRLLKKLHSEELGVLKNDERFLSLLSRANSMSD